MNLALNIVSFMWNFNDISFLKNTLLPKFCNYIVGGAIYVIDRIYENYRFEVEEQFSIPYLNNQSKNQFIRLYYET